MTLPLNTMLLQVAPRYISAEEACARLGVDEDALLVLILAGKVRAALFGDQVMVAEDSLLAPNGEDRLQSDAETGTILPGTMNGVAIGSIVNHPETEENQRQPWTAGDDINARLAAIRREDFAHLEGKPITVSEAAEKYGVPVATIHTWIHREYLSPLGKKGRQREINEAEIAYCAAIYHVRKRFGTRAPLLNKDGSPYLLRDPELARLRRKAKQLHK